jgi:hypothetical protein
MKTRGKKKKKVVWFVNVNYKTPIGWVLKSNKAFLSPKN